jgi:hypothetical protein
MKWIANEICWFTYESQTGTHSSGGVWGIKHEGEAYLCKKRKEKKGNIVWNEIEV